MKMNLPNKITTARLILIPLVVFFYLATFIPNNIGKFIALGLFMLAAYTDHLDGYYARKLNQVTNLGTFLDSTADKLLVFATLILVCVDHTIPPIFAELILIIMMSRDFLISALRQVAASNNVVISADKLGKLKTLLQDIGLSALLLFVALNGVLGNQLILDIVMWIGYCIIGLATLVSLISGVNYLVKNKGVFKV